MSASDFELGQRAQLNSDNTVGIVRYIGEIHVATGEFIGLELSGPSGKNDGSVQGRRYFTCPPKHGIFVKPNAAKPITVQSPSPVPAVKKSSRNSMAPPAATSSKKPASRQSMAPPAAASSTKPTSRLSMAPPAKRQSVVPSSSRLSLAGRQPVQAGTSGKSTPSNLSTRNSISGPSGKITPPIETQQEPITKAIPAAKALPAAKPLPVENFNIEIEELKAKISVLESRRDEREALLSAALADKEKYASIVQKLESKLKPLSEELAELRSQAQEFKDSKEQAERALEDYETTLENITLDRELALELNDKITHEMQTMQVRLEELELQNEIFREEKELQEATFEGERDPTDVVHLQVENHRMREALLRLRDITTGEKVDLEWQIQQLQKELNELPDIKKKVADLQEQVSQAKEIIENQKDQIDSTEDNETLIMDMQTKLQTSAEKISELESLLQMSSESEEVNEQIITSLEEGQRNTQAKLDHTETLFQAATERIIEYERTIADQDDTVEKYRKLTSTLQSNLREAQGDHEVSQQEKVRAEKRAQNLQELAKETQKSTTRTQLREYQQDMIELKRILAEKELAIVKAYLPETYKVVEGSTQSLLRINSIHGKIGALKRLLKHNADGPFVNDYDINKLIRPKLITRLAYLELLSEQFDEYFSNAPLSAFIKLSELNNELHSMDKAVDAWIDGLIKDSLAETDILGQVRMYTNFMDNIAEVHMPENPRNNSNSDCALDYLRQLHYIEHDMDGIKIFLNYLKEMFVKHLNIDLEADELDKDQYEEHSQALIKIMNSMHEIWFRERKMQDRWNEVKQRKMTFNEKVEEKILQTRNLVEDAFSMTFDVTQGFSKLVNEEREDELTFLDLRPVIGNVPYEKLNQKLLETLKTITAAKDLMENSDCLNEELEESVLQPWIQHNITLKNEEVDVHELTQQLATSKTELNERNTTIAVNKKTIEELNVSIEVLNKRIHDSGTKNDQATKLERALLDSTNREVQLAKNIGELTRQLKEALANKEQKAVDATAEVSRTIISTRASDDTITLKRQVANLESSIREAHAAKRQHVLVDFEPLQLGRKRELGDLTERTSKTLRAVFEKHELERKENKKGKSLRKRQQAAERALNGFRRALYN